MEATTTATHCPCGTPRDASAATCPDCGLYVPRRHVRPGILTRPLLVQVLARYVFQDLPEYCVVFREPDSGATLQNITVSRKLAKETISALTMRSVARGRDANGVRYALFTPQQQQ